MKNFANLKRDYGEFLALKGVLNIPMVRYPFTEMQMKLLSRLISHVPRLSATMSCE